MAYSAIFGFGDEEIDYVRLNEAPNDEYDIGPPLYLLQRHWQGELVDE